MSRLFFKIIACIWLIHSQVDAQNLDHFNEEQTKILSQISGLTSPKVYCILKDKKGFVWLGTSDGLNRYDGNSITVFKHDLSNPKSIGSNAINCLFQDQEGGLWIGTNNGLYTFNYHDQSFTNHYGPKIKVYSICEDKDGKIWLGSRKGLISYNQTTKKFQHVPFLEEVVMNATKSNFSLEILTDRHGEIWIGTWNHGIYRMNPITGEYVRFTPEGFENYDILKTGHISSIEEGPDGSLWFGSWNYGLLKVATNRQKITNFLHHHDNPNSLNGNEIKALKFDEKGFLWIGMEESGLDRFAPEKEEFIHYFNAFQTSDLFEGPSIYSIMVDDQSQLWLGFRNDGVKIVPLQKSPFKLYKNESVETTRVFSVCETPQKIFSGIKGGIELWDLKNNSLKYFELPTKETPISFYYDGKDLLYLGTYKGSLFTFHIEKHQFNKIPLPAFQHINKDNKIECFYPLSDRQLLIGCKRGLVKFDPETGKQKLVLNNWVHSILEGENESLWLMGWSNIQQYYPQTGKVTHYESKAKGDTKSQYLSNDKTIYLGTDLGFYKQDLLTDSISLFKDIFPYVNNQVNSIVPDNQGNLWFTADHGLVFFDLTNQKFRTFDKTDGLPEIRFQDGVGMKLKNGNILFGGEGGMITFDPLKIEDTGNQANLTFTNISILNKTLNPNDPSYPFDGDISEIDQIEIDYAQNIVKIDFSLLSYINPDKHRFQYLLEGFNNNWFDLGNQNFVTFTNLDAGDYILKIKAANENNNWGPVKELKIKVNPPWYNTWLAYFFYALSFVLIILWIKQFYKNREVLKSKIKDEHLKFEKVKAKAKNESVFSQMRLKFFTNISHEFRTPLTLILGPLDNFVKNNKAPEEEHLRLMHRNAERLQRLINQILDFRSLEGNNLKLEPSWGDVIRFVKETAQLFVPMAQQKELTFNIYQNTESLHAWFDQDKLEKVIYNLLSNAFKHTKTGEINISISTLSKDELTKESTLINTPYDTLLELVISDTGEGIEADKIPHIFDRFYHLQSHTSSTTQGTGIGLTLTKELVEIHGGQIHVESQLQKGSKFKVVIPINTAQKEGTDLLVPEEQGAPESLTIDTEEPQEEPTLAEHKVPTILVVEDNEDLRDYMHVEFSKKYQLEDAENGKEGLEKALKIIPDLIISDLMMPVMDGIEFCKAIKKDERTSHIPIIILTAHGSHINKIQGYEIGADDYITKPFASDLLTLRVENLLRSRQELQSKFSREVRLQPRDLQISNMDERFLNKAMEVVEANLNNSDFNADSFASEMCMSRVHLYRKLKALTNQSVSDFVKTARLKLAAKLVGENKLTIKEAAFTVGFKDPKYFSKCFRQQFGVNPSDYQETNIQDN
ncbi:two-component regulator propeller domain-containing protein [Flexithrix dorotheae]|uniref:two-component regulator propeller domain-containing protein n=1 Tax=Flexithrix dorotheae TaxID=70993 RepID=UPI0012FC3059|nr:two-component regulator propeller domain-containing protein [Flexithrix dorotheae]